jgi:hypothetical protein
MTESAILGVLPDIISKAPILSRDVRGWVNQNRHQFGVVIRLAMQKKEACLRSDCHTDFVSQFEPAAAFEALFREKNLHMPKKLGLISESKSREDWQVSQDDGSPRFWERPAVQLSALTPFEEGEDHL